MPFFLRSFAFFFSSFSLRLRSFSKAFLSLGLSTLPPPIATLTEGADTLPFKETLASGGFLRVLVVGLLPTTVPVPLAGLAFAMEGLL